MIEPKYRHQGFTLIEMLVALALGALMMAGIAASFSAITQTQNLTRDYEQIQETLRFTTSLISRSLRTADMLVHDPTENAPTDTNQFSVQRIGDNERRSCNGQTPDTDTEFYETYYQPTGSNQLACRVSSTDGSSPDWAGTEVIAYGIENFSLQCLLYDDSDELTEAEYVSCDGVVHDAVIAVKITLQFDAGEFARLESYPNHIFTATLRSRLRVCARGDC